MLSLATITAGGASAIASTHTANTTTQQHSGCPKTAIASTTRDGRFDGILRPQAKFGCKSMANGDPAGGTPPLLYHGGPIMGSTETGPVVLTPIFWNPAGYTMSDSYKSIITRYLQDVASASGQHTNVYSTLNQYYGNNGSNRYQVRLATALNDTGPLPTSGCHVNKNDTINIYADSSGYNACLDDHQVTTETDRVVAALGMPVDLAHIYILFLPKGVESCFVHGQTRTAANACTINHWPSARYCAYHSQDKGKVIYANMPYPIYDSSVGFTCGSDAKFPDVQSPNGNPNADTEISPTSHEVMESITDPTGHSWFDSSGFENGDECAYVYGTSSGLPGKEYNQVIGGHHYLTQEEFSNRDFNYTGGGCLQAE